MSRHVVRHIAVKEGEGFDLDLDRGEHVISAEFDHPYFHLVLLLEDEYGGDHSDGTMSPKSEG